MFSFANSLPNIQDRVWKRYMQFPLILKVATLWDRASGLAGSVAIWNKQQFELVSAKLGKVDWLLEEAVKSKEEYSIHFTAVSPLPNHGCTSC